MKEKERDVPGGRFNIGFSYGFVAWIYTAWMLIRYMSTWHVYMPYGMCCCFLRITFEAANPLHQEEKQAGKKGKDKNQKEPRKHY